MSFSGRRNRWFTPARDYAFFMTSVPSCQISRLDKCAYSQSSLDGRQVTCAALLLGPCRRRLRGRRLQCVLPVARNLVGELPIESWIKPNAYTTSHVIVPY